MSKVQHCIHKSLKFTHQFFSLQINRSRVKKFLDRDGFNLRGMFTLKNITFIPIWILWGKLVEWFGYGSQTKSKYNLTNQKKKSFIESLQYTCIIHLCVTLVLLLCCYVFRINTHIQKRLTTTSKRQFAKKHSIHSEFCLCAVNDRWMINMEGWGWLLQYILDQCWMNSASMMPCCVLNCKVTLRI